MRHNKLTKQMRKAAPHLTQAEKLHKRRVKRKEGPSAQRRKARRKPLQPNDPILAQATVEPPS